MTVERYGNQWFKGTRWLALGGNLLLEFEDYSKDEGLSPSFYLQIGGDALFTQSISIFNRSLTVEFFPTWKFN